MGPHQWGETGLFSALKLTNLYHLIGEAHRRAAAPAMPAFSKHQATLPPPEIITQSRYYSRHDPGVL